MYLRPPRCYGDALRAIGDHVARARYVLSNIEAAVLVSPHSIVEVRAFRLLCHPHCVDNQGPRVLHVNLWGF